MASSAQRLLPLSPGRSDLVAALVAAVGLLLLARLALLTPVFTDYEVEAEPAIRALLAGDVAVGLRALPLYGGAVLLTYPFLAVVDLLGGGTLAIFRAAAVPGALGVVALAVVGTRWMRDAGAGTRLQLLPPALLGLSPCVALAWNFGHFEELLVGSAAILGLILVARGAPRGIVAGGVLLGLAIAAKASAIVVFPVALACIATRPDLIRLVASSAVAGIALLLPVVLPKFQQFSTTITATGADRVSSQGNLWWFLGPRNPNFVAPDATSTEPAIRELFTTDNAARLAPEFAADHAHELIVVLAGLLAFAWWWRIGRALDRERTREWMASVLLVAGAILWWRAVADPWFQAYYLTPALIAIVLADARVGRLPVLGLVAWAALWLLHGQNAPDMGLDADATSALRLAWLLPTGLWLTTRALRRPTT